MLSSHLRATRYSDLSIVRPDVIHFYLITSAQTAFVLSPQLYYSFKNISIVQGCCSRHTNHFASFLCFRDFRNERMRYPEVRKSHHIEVCYIHGSLLLSSDCRRTRSSECRPFFHLLLSLGPVVSPSLFLMRSKFW